MSNVEKISTIIYIYIIIIIIIINIRREIIDIIDTTIDYQ
jgi:hypothetical protein